MANANCCAAEGCESAPFARGLCTRCYGKAYRAGQLPPKQPKAGCHSLTEVDIEAKTAVCAICGPTRIRVRVGHGHECRTVRVNNHQRYRAKHGRYRAYKLSAEQYGAMVEAQGGQCAICGTTPERLVIDHCHETGVVRGLLCQSCNVGLGFMRDNPVALLAAAEYLVA